MARWAHEVGIPPDRLFLVNLRGRRNPLANATDRDRLAGMLREQRVESLIVDPFGRAYSGSSQNDAGEVYGWLVRLDEFVRGQVGARDLVLTTHAGWDGERSRGSSALEDWADVIMTMTRDQDTGDRFLRATGRDVDLEEDRLDFDPATRTLTLAGVGGRKLAAAARRQVDLGEAVVALLNRMPDGLKAGEIEAQLKMDGWSFQRGDAAKAARAAAEDDLILCTHGKRGALIYTPKPEAFPTIPDHSPGDGPTIPDPSLYGRGSRGSTGGSCIPEAEEAVNTRNFDTPGANGTDLMHLGSEVNR